MYNMEQNDIFADLITDLPTHNKKPTTTEIHLLEEFFPEEENNFLKNISIKDNLKLFIILLFTNYTLINVSNNKIPILNKKIPTLVNVFIFAFLGVGLYTIMLTFL